MSTSETLWQQIEADAAQAPSGYVAQRVLPQSAVDLRFAVLRPTGERVLLLGGPRTELERVEDLPAAAAMSLELVSASADNPPRPVLRLMLTNRAYADLFSLLADDLLRTLSAALTATESIGLFVQRVRRWHEFMRSADPDGLSPEAQRGLFGELLLLADRLVPAIGATAGLAAWTGPQRTPHDFQLPAWAIEVKTTAATQPDSVSITNVRQLEAPTGARLLLAVVVVDVTRAAGTTLPELVDRCRQLCAGAACVPGMDERLLASGYFDVHARRYAATRYSLRRLRTYEVRDGFPRILERDVPAGLSEVRFRLLLSAIATFAVDDGDLASLLRSAP